MNNRGFTLIELIVVMAVLAIMLTIALPALSSYRESAQYTEVARSVLISLREARSLAVTENQNITVNLDLNNHQLSYDGKIKNFPANITLEAKNAVGDAWATTGTISSVFRSQGSCTSEFYVRVNEDPKLEIKIEYTATGLAKI